jgi:hypothetical protein
MKKALLTLFILICLTATIYSGYLLFTKQITPITGSVLLAIGIIVFIWSFSLARRHNISGGVIFIAIIIIALFASTTGAYAGYEPLSSTKDKVSTWLESNTSNITTSRPNNPTTTSQAKVPTQIILKEYFLAGSFLFPEVIELNKIQQWVYTSSQQLSFKSLNPPYVVNAAIRTRTSQVATELEVRVYQKGDPYQVSDIPITTRSIAGMGGRQAFIIKEKGDYIIDVKSVGCEWWVMVGHESEAYRQ